MEYSERIENVPVKLNGKIVGTASIESSGEIEIDLHATVDTSSKLNELFHLARNGITFSVCVGFEFDPAVSERA